MKKREKDDDAAKKTAPPLGFRQVPKARQRHPAGRGGLIGSAERTDIDREPQPQDGHTEHHANNGALREQEDCCRERSNQQRQPQQRREHECHPVVRTLASVFIQFHGVRFHVRYADHHCTSSEETKLNEYGFFCPVEYGQGWEIDEIE